MPSLPALAVKSAREALHPPLCRPRAHPRRRRRAAGAQQAPAPGKKVLTVEDYTKWRTISGQEISGDGQWVAYGLSLTNTAPAESEAGAAPRAARHEPGRRGARTRRRRVLVRLEVDRLSGRSERRTRRPRRTRRWRRRHPPAALRRRRIRRSPPGSARSAGDSRSDASRDSRRRPFPATRRPPPARPLLRGHTPDRRRARAAANAARPAQPTRVELRNLATGAVQSWQDIQSFTFSPTSTYLVLRRRPRRRRRAAAADAAPRGGGRGAAAVRTAAPAAPAGPRGVDVILHNLATGRDQLLGSVGDIAFNKTGDLLAYTVDAAVKDSNGLFVLDLPQRPHQHARQRRASIYNRLTWSDDGTALAVLKGARRRQDARARQRADRVPQRPGGAQRRRGARRSRSIRRRPAGFPKGWVVSDRAALEWSDDNKRVFFGIKEAGARARRRRRARAPTSWRTSTSGTRRRAHPVGADDPRRAGSQLHLPRGVRRGRRRSSSSWPIRRCATSTSRRTAAGPSAATRAATSHDYKRAGRRHLPRQHDDRRAHADAEEPVDQHLDRQPHVRHLARRPASSSTGRTTSSRRTTSTRRHVEDARRREPGELRRHGVRSSGTEAGVRHRRLHQPTRSRSSSQQRYDLWALPLDGSAARNLTNGAGTKSEIRFRYVRTEPRSEPRQRPAAARGGGGGGGRGGGGAARARRSISRSRSRSRPTASTPRRPGFYELANGELKELVYEDASFSNPVKAAKADKYPLHAPDVRRVPRPARVGSRTSRTRRRSATRIRSRPTTSGAIASCSTSRTRTASGCRASSRCPTTTSPARSGRCS